jgi:hypothetical protein
MEESKIAHLQMIQEVINRMAGSSLKMKGTIMMPFP